MRELLFWRLSVRLTGITLCLTQTTLRFMTHESRITYHVSRITYHGSTAPVPVRLRHIDQEGATGLPVEFRGDGVEFAGNGDG